MSEKTPGFPLGPALVLFGVVGVLLVALLSGQPRIPPAPPATAAPTEVAVLPTATQPAQNAAANNPAVQQGQMLFSSTCTACHGFNARGIPGLGKDLVASPFVHGLSDADLLAFIIAGRPIGDPLNTTGVAMPARGANPSLTDDQIMSIIAYIRSLQAAEEGVAAPTAAPAAETTSESSGLPIDNLNATPTTEFVLPITGLNLATPTPTTEFVLPITGLNLTPVPAEPLTDGAQIYAVACSTCHGANGEGGSASAVADWSLTDDEILAVLTTVYPAASSEIQHPVYGGYLNLNADQLHLLIEYLHMLPTS